MSASHSVDNSEDDSKDEMSDNELMDKFLSYLRENFDDEEKKLMIQQLFRDGGYQLGEGEEDFPYQSEPDDAVFREEQVFNDYSRPLDHSKKNGFSQKNKKRMYPMSLEDYYYNRHSDDGLYRLPYESERTKRSMTMKENDQIEDDPLLENIEDFLEDSNLHVTYTTRSNFKRRVRRHLGAHDDGGIQRLISTGTLAPPLIQNQSRGETLLMSYLLFTGSILLRIM